MCDRPGATDADALPGDRLLHGRPGLHQRRTLDRYQAKALGTFLLKALGHHVVKAGVDVEVMSSTTHARLHGLRALQRVHERHVLPRLPPVRLPDGARTSRVPGSPAPALHVRRRVGGFVQDSWSIIDRVTLNAGVRYDTQTSTAADGKLAFTLPNQWSPRVGLIYDSRTGRAKLFANYARYYESVPLDMVDRSFPERGVSSTYNSPACDPRRPGTQQRGVCTGDANRHAQATRWTPTAPGAPRANRAPVDPDIRPSPRTSSSWAASTRWSPSRAGPHLHPALPQPRHRGHEPR